MKIHLLLLSQNFGCHFLYLPSDFQGQYDHLWAWKFKWIRRYSLILHCPILGLPRPKMARFLGGFQVFSGRPIVWWCRHSSFASHCLWDRGVKSWFLLRVYLWFETSFVPGGDPTFSEAAPVSCSLSKIFYLFWELSCFRASSGRWTFVCPLCCRIQFPFHECWPNWSHLVSKTICDLLLGSRFWLKGCLCYSCMIPNG